jgi:hypothetical protein
MSANDIYAVGENEKVLHYDGSFWTSAREDKPYAPRAAWAESKTRMVVASYSGGVYIFDGGSWKETYCGADLRVSAFGGTAINDLYGYFHDRTILHFDGSGWSVSADSLNREQHAFWTAGSDDIFSVGSRSIYRFDGTGWSVMLDDRTFFGTGTFHLLDVWGSSSENIYAVGINGLEGVIARYDGEAWKRMEGEFGGFLEGVWGTSENNVFAVGHDGIFHYDGHRWSSQPYPPWARPRWVTGRSPGLIVAVSSNYLLRYERGFWNYQEINCCAMDVFAARDGSIIRLTNYGISYIEE